MINNKGLRFNKGKLRYDLIHPWSTEQMVSVMTKGANKYTIQWENEWEKLITVANVIELNLNTVKGCVAHVTRNSSGKIILNTQRGKGLILGNGQRVTEKERENWMLLEEVILNSEREIKSLNGSVISENLILQKNPTKSYVKKVVGYVEAKNIFTLTTTIKQDYSEESYVVSATTVLECLEMMKRVLEEHLNISFSQNVLKNNGERNWERGMKWSNVLASAKRHMAAIERGEDYDIDPNCSECQKSTKDNWVCKNHTGELHAALLQTNAHFLTAYYKIYPEGDDRPKPYLSHKKIGLDIDDVLADFVGAWLERYPQNKPNFWNFDKDFGEKYEALKNDKEFWMNIKPKIDPSELLFEPTCYITSRGIPSEWTEEWLQRNGFPAVPVYTVGLGESKVEIAKQSGIDIFVDDRFENFVELNNAGICTFLMDANHNKRYDVQARRIYSLKDLV